MSAILVTGSTGTIGKEVVRALRARGATVRAAVRNDEGGDASTVKLEWADPASIRAALEGVERAFLLTPFSEQQAEHGRAFVRAAKQAGLRQLVKLSVIGADAEPGIRLGRWHREVERELEDSGVPFTILRPTNFMNNFLGYYPPDASGTLALPWGDAKVSFVAPSDVGEVAATVLGSDAHLGRVYTPTGPDALSGSEIAALLASAAGRKITYVDVPEAAARDAMAKQGVPGWMTDAMMELHAICKAGWVGATTNDVQAITHHAPVSLREFATAHAAELRGA